MRLFRTPAESAQRSAIAFGLAKEYRRQAGSLDEFEEVARIANAIPCESIHPNGAPCIRCNPVTTFGGYKTGPDYMELRIAAAREVAKC